MRRVLLFALVLAAARVAAPAATRAAPDQMLGMALMSATVAGTALAAGSGVVSIDRPDTGVYNIAFERDLEACTCTASFGAHNGSISSGGQNFISANCPNGTGNNVRVHILSNGLFSNLPFQLIVFCPK
jgi:hypothetical protein